MQVIPYFAFEGNAAEAMEFYAKAFDGELTYVMTYGENEEMASQNPGYGDKILHATLKLNGGLFYFSDLGADRKTIAGNAIEVNINFDSVEQLDKAFNILKADGLVHMEPQDMFWNARFASITDKYGNGWSLNFNYPEE